MSATQAPRRFINNFDLMRLLAASAVVLNHCYGLTTGSWASDPLYQLFGIDLGRIAVDIFFVMSGFLVTGSLLRQDCLKNFWRARLLRVFPGIIVMTVLTVFVLGPIVSSSGFGGYILDAGTWKYLLRNCFLFAGVEFRLPGVFENLVYPNFVNGSLWSLPMELRIYVVLTLCWFLAGWLRGDKLINAKRVFLLVLLGATLFTLYHYVQDKPVNHHPRLASMFFAGALTRLYIDRIRWSGKLALIMLLLLVGCSMFLRGWLEVVYVLVMPYCVLYVAHSYIPVVSAMRFPDYSYGIYIYSFPLQQMLSQFIPGIQAMEMLLLSFPATLALAALSWYLVEKPAMAFKKGRPAVH